MENQSEQLTVEQCLAELRGMGKEVDAEIVFGTRYPIVSITIWSGLIIPAQRFKANGSTLGNAMVKVRKWAKEQQ